MKITLKTSNGAKTFRHFGAAVRYEESCWGPSIFTVLSQIVGGPYQAALLKDLLGNPRLVLIERMFD